MDKKEILELYGEDALRVDHYGKVYRDLRKRVNRADVAVRGLLHNLDRIAELEQENEELTACILELAEIIGGGE